MHGSHPTYVAVPRELNNNADKVPSYSSCFGGRHAAQSLISKYTGIVSSGAGISCDLVNRTDPPIECNIGCNVSNFGSRKLAPLHCGQLGEKFNEQATKLRLRAEVPHLTRKDVNQIREPFYDILCQNLLQNGYHKAFAEMFHLYEQQNEERRKAGPDSPLWFIPPIAEQPEKIKLLAHYLSEVEAASRRRDVHTMFTSYTQLGKAFQECPDDMWLAEHFFNYALEVAQFITGDDGLKLANAHLHYGLLLQALGRHEFAAKSFQEFYQLTRNKQWKSDDGQLLSKLASKYLVGNYLKRIDTYPEEHHSDRLELGWQAHKIAMECDDWKSEAPVWLRLGELLEAAKDYDKALEFYRTYFDKAASKEDYGHLSKASEALAKLCQSQNKMEESIQHLQKFACICERHGQWVQLGRACQMLGATYDAIGDFPSALKWMKKAYHLPHMIQGLKIENCKESTEAARIMIGVSRAHLLNNAYVMNMMGERIPSLMRVIQWKSNPINEEEVFPIKELKLPPIRIKDREPARAILKYAKHPATGFLYHME